MENPTLSSVLEKDFRRSLGDRCSIEPVGGVEIGKIAGLAESLDALERDHGFLLKGDVFTADVIDNWISMKRSKDVAAVNLRPHPYEFFLYYDV